MTITETAPARADLPVFVADSTADRADWLAKRLPGVTGTEVSLLVGGGRSTWKRIYDEKRNGGESFQGNRATRRGHRREEHIAREVFRRYQIPASGLLFARHDNPRHLVTPDCLSLDHGPDHITIGAEIKSTVEDYSHAIPRKYADQIEWQLYVLGAERILFVWEPCDEHGQPLLPVTELEFGTHMRWIVPNETRRAQLIKTADEFLAWSDAGAPDISADLPDDVAEAVAQFAHWRAAKTEAEDGEKAAVAIIRAHIEADEEARESGFKASTEHGSISYSVTHGDEFDADAWAVAAPKAAAAFTRTKARYRKPKTSTTLKITPKKASK